VPQRPGFDNPRPAPVLVGLALCLALSSCALLLDQGGGATAPTAPPPVQRHAIAPDPAASLSEAAGWERRNTTFYQIWVAAFADSDGDGTGDLAGIREKIDAGYFTDLGVNALWLSPIFEAASLTAGSGNKHGYDSIDYTRVSPLFGDATGLRDLILAAHGKGIRVVFDFVPNHGSDRNPWFHDPAKKDWYLWRPLRPAGWTGLDSSSDWYGSGPYYYGLFDSGMPDYNFRNADLRNTITNVAIDWLNFGFDGMRVDAVKYLYENEGAGGWKDQSETLAYFQDLHSQVLAAYADSGKMMMAENWDEDLTRVRPYLLDQGRAGFDLTLDFIWPNLLIRNLDGTGSPAEAEALLYHLVDETDSLPPGSGFAVFQSNHDNAASRPATAFAGEGRKIWLAAALSILGKGTPIVYYGNEIGQAGPAGNDTNLRRPFDWQAQATQAPDLDPESLWTWHSQLLHLRSTHPAWKDPAIRALATVSPAIRTLATVSPGILAFEIRGTTGARAVVIANISSNVPPSATIIDLGPSPPARATVILGPPGGATLTASLLSLSDLPPFGLRVVDLAEAAAVPAPVYRSSDPDPSGFVAPLPPPPPPVQLYLRGDWNGWGTGLPLATQADGSLAATATFAGGQRGEFKFGSADWSTALGYQKLALDPARSTIPATAISDSGDPYQNLVLILPAAGAWTFHLDEAASTWWVD